MPSKDDEPPSKTEGPATTGDVYASQEIGEMDGAEPRNPQALVQPNQSWPGADGGGGDNVDNKEVANGYKGPAIPYGSFSAGAHSWNSNLSNTDRRSQEMTDFYDSYNQDWETSGRSSPSNISSHSLPCLSILENHYSLEVNSVPENSAGRTMGRQSRVTRRQLSNPASGLRARSLSRARFIQKVNKQRTTSHSSLHIPDERVADVEQEEESDEVWVYKPLSFWTLPRSNILVLISLGLVDLTLYMCLSILAPFFPKEAEGKGVSNTVSGWIFGCFALVQFITSPIFGYLCPRIGSRFLFITGHFVAGVCAILFGFLDWIPTENSATMFVTFCFLVRVMLALGCTASATASFAIMANTFPDNIATVFGILETFTGVGLMVGPALGGVLYQAGGFILPFVSLGAVMVASVPFLCCILKPQGDEGDTPIEPSSVRQILCIPAVLIVLFATIIGSLIWAILDPTLEPHLRVYNLSPSIVGLIFLLMSFFYALSSPFWGWIADRVADSTPLLVIGFFASTVGLLLLAPSTLLGFPKGFRAIWLDLIALIVLGVSASLALVPTFEKILDSAEKAGVEDNFAMYGVVAGLWGGAYALGEFIGPSVGGFIMDTFGFEWCMIFAAAPCLFISIILAILWLYETKAGPTPCLIAIPPNNALSEPVSENTPLLQNNACEGLPPSHADAMHSSGLAQNQTNTTPQQGGFRCPNNTPNGYASLPQST